MKLQHSLILAINSSILAVLFVFTGWLFTTSKREVEVEVVASLDRAAAMTERLARVRERELNGIAQSQGASPMLRGAVATNDADTIADVLSGVADKNGLTVAALVDGKASVYASKPDAVKKSVSQLTAGMFTGRASGDEPLTLLVAQDPTTALLDVWSEISGVRYAVIGRDFNNLPAEDQGLLGRLPTGVSPITLDSVKTKYYARRANVLDGRFNVALFVPRAPFWQRFEARRNSLVVLGSVLFFLGLLMSIGFSRFISTEAAADAPRAGAEWSRLVADIDSIRGQLLAKKD
jgi:hypothetical protein